MRDPKKLRLYRWSGAALRALRTAGFRLVLITNQSGVARGYFPASRVRETHRRLAALLRKEGARLDAMYACPHAPDAGCDCRKPKTGLLRQAAHRFGIPLRASYVVGDKVTDVQLAHNAGCHAVMVKTGYGREQFRKLVRSRTPRPDQVTRNLESAARWIVADHASRSESRGVSRA